MSLTCKDVMSADQITLLPTDKISKAFGLIHKQGIRFLPVVDVDGTYLGVFTSPTLIKLLLPRAMTINIGGKNANKGLSNLSFYNIDAEDFHQSLKEVKDEQVQNHLSNPDMIPVIEPDSPIMEGVLLLHKFKRHVILVEQKTNKFIGVLSNNAVLHTIFEENYRL